MSDIVLAGLFLAALVTDGLLHVGAYRRDLTLDRLAADLLATSSYVMPVPTITELETA